MCAGAGYHGSGARDGEADDRRGRDKRKAEHLSVLTDPSGMIGYPNQSVRRLAPFPYSLCKVHTVVRIFNSLRRTVDRESVQYRMYGTPKSVEYQVVARFVSSGGL